MRRRASLLLLMAVPLAATSLKRAVVGSRHDLTVTGTGSVKSAALDACIFCHAPHNANPNITPLWDHALSTQTYTTYTSSTYSSGVQTPALGSSRLCLSCHDGTVAAGLTTSNGLISTSGSIRSTDVLGTNLGTSHPVAMTPADDGSLAPSLFTSPPVTKDPAVKLVAGKVECVTCHDPHVPNNDLVQQMFLVRSNINGGLCLACHDPTRVQPNFLNGWTAGSHATATNTVPQTAQFGAYGNVAANACSNCHFGHNNAVGPRNQIALEEAACTSCHSGVNVSPALRNIGAEFNKTYRHPTMTVSGAHDPTEALPVNNTRHSECADCHNPHTASPQTSTPIAPAIQNDVAGVNGYDTSGAVKVATTEYQVCFKCHADSSNKPATSVFGRTAVRYPAGPMPPTYPVQPPKPADQYNLRLKFSSAIGHNVMGLSTVTTSNTTLRPYMLTIAGANDLNHPLTTTTRLYCTDCHTNDQARSSAGTGPNGPHGSSFPHLLQFNLFQDTIGGGGGGGGTTGAALCNKCHNLTSVARISPHGDHQDVGCTTCHDPHGVIGGTPAANRAMMNFDTSIAAKATTYFGYFYMGAGTNQKGCYTTCHGENHNPRTY